MAREEEKEVYHRIHNIKGISNILYKTEIVSTGTPGIELTMFTAAPANQYSPRYKKYGSFHSFLKITITAGTKYAIVANWIIIL